MTKEDQTRAAGIGESTGRGWGNLFDDTERTVQLGRGGLPCVGEVFPSELTYCLEFEVEAALTCPSGPVLAYALDRFRADEERLAVGLMAVLATAGAGTVLIGSCSRKGAAYVGYATRAETDAAKPRLPRGRSVAGGECAAGAAEFHLFYPDCPACVSQYETLPWPRVRELVLEFAGRGMWAADVEWFDR